MSKPVTKGGFSNDGSSIMKQAGDVSSLFTTTFTTGYEHAADYYDKSLTAHLSNPDVAQQAHQMTISTTLHSSHLTLDHFYDLQAMSAFLTTNIALKPKSTPHRVAIQSPDELLVDCNFIIKALETQYRHTNIHFYILGDTSYSSCCVDVVAARHVEADFILHLGFACLSQVETIPVFYAFGSLTLFDHKIALPADSTHPPQNVMYQYCFPLLTMVFKICSSPISLEEIDYSPSYDDYEEYPDDLIYNTDGEKPQLLVFPEQRYSPQMQLIQHIFTLLGFHTRSLTPVSVSIPNQSHIEEFITATILPYLQQHPDVYPLFQQKDAFDLVFATPSFSQGRNTTSSCCSQQTTTESTACCDTSNTTCCSKPSQPSTDSAPIQPQPLESILDTKTLSFAGFQIPIQFPKEYNSDEVKALAQRQIWHRFFNKSQWKFIFLSNHIPFYADSTTEDAATVALKFKTIPDPGSATFLTHLAMNFTQHYIYDCFPYFTPPFTLDATAENPHQGWLVDLMQQAASTSTSSTSTTINSITPAELTTLSTTELFSPSREQSRVLSQRFYLVEKAKNSPVIGIVVCTLSAKLTLPILERLKKLLTQNGIKYYVVVIGKLNEAKLLNFGDISMFVVISCPMGVLFRFQNKHGQLHHTSIDQYSLQKVGDVKQAQNNTPTTIASMIDLITPYECELAFNTNEFSWNGLYTTHFADVHANSGRLGLKKEKITEDDLEAVDAELASQSATKSVDAGSSKREQKINQNQAQDDGDVDDESVTGVRYSSIDNKYHQITTKKVSTTTTSTDPSESSTQLIEQQTFGLIDPTTNKQLIFVRNPATGQITAKQREFTGLAQDYELTAENMAIQPGLHGTSEGYISVADLKQETPKDL